MTTEHVGTKPGDVAAQLKAVAAVLRTHIVDAVVESGAEARDPVLGLIPDGAEVHSGKSKTLEEVGLSRELAGSGRYDAIRGRISTEPVGV